MQDIKKMRRLSSHLLAVELGILMLCWVSSATTIPACTHKNNHVENNYTMAEVIIFQVDQGKIFEVHQGDRIVIRIDENPTTGYQWEITSINQQIVELVESDYVIAPGGGIGGGGTRIFRFKAISPGTTSIQLKLCRAWEPGDTSIDSFSVNIQVH